MLRRFALLFVCAILPLSLANADGFPSRPKFQEVTVRNSVDSITIDADNIAKTTPGSLTLSTSSGTVVIDAASQVQLQAADGIFLTSDAQIDLTSGTNVTVNGETVPKFKYAFFGGSGADCLFVSSPSRGVAACSRTGVGSYGFTFGAGTPSYTARPVCTATVLTAGTTYLARVDVTSTAGVTVSTYTTAAALADATGAYLVCIGT